MIVVDTSALVEVILDQKARARVLPVLLGREKLMLSAVTLYETGIVLLTRRGPSAVAKLQELLLACGATVAGFDSADAMLATEAYRQYGKVIHPAGLNFGDCPAYALAKLKAAALLFVGDDFGQTDVKGVL
jgi:ribonuclease VapC